MLGQLRKDRAARLGQRNSLTQEELYALFNTQGELASDCFEFVFNKLAEALEVPKAKLRPADRFKVELAPLKGKWGEVDDSDFSVHVLFDVLTRKHGIHAHFDSIETVSDFINLFCRK